MRWLLGVASGIFAVGWLFFLPVFVKPDYGVGLFCFSVGFVVMVWGMHTVRPLHLSRWLLVIGASAVVAGLVVPFPFNIGCLVLLMGVGFGVVKSFFSEGYLSGVLASGLLMAGGVLVVQAVGFWIYSVVVSLGHRVDVLSGVVSGLLNAGGVTSAVNQGLVFVQTSQGAIPVSITWEKLGLLPWVLFVVGFFLVMVLWYRRAKWGKMVLLFLAGSGVFLVVRLVVLVVWFVSFDVLSVFWDPVVMAVSFLPFCGVVAGILYQFSEGVVCDPFAVVRVDRGLVIAGLMVLLCVSLGVAAVGWQDPGVVKGGRVLIDEVHSDWEDSVRPLDTEWFGLLSTYNYYSWAEWINATYAVKRHVGGDLSELVLRDVDILILKCPTASFRLEEVGVIADFVEDGGGLWLIGDHTDVFGMNTFLNQVASVFGLRFHNDATYMLGSGNMTRFLRPGVLPHPIVARVPVVEFMTSCTLGMGWGGEPVIYAGGMSAEPGTYATENFFRESVASAEAEFGMFVQMAAVRYGRGRVVAFSDSTVFSSFSVFSDGYQGLTMGALNYLNRMNTEVPYVLLLWGCCVFFGVIVVWLLWSRRRLESAFVVCVAGLLGVGLMIPLVGWVNDQAYSVSEMRFSLDEVVFDVGHTESRVDVRPTVSIFEEADNFGTLYVWSQRVGLTPRQTIVFDDSVVDAEVVMLVNPSKSFSDAELGVLSQCVDQGGCVVVFDSIENPGSTANEVLGGFGLWRYIDFENRVVLGNGSDVNSSVGNVSLPVIRVSGGVSLGELVDGVSVIRGVEVVNDSTGVVGRVLVVVDASSFSNKVLGGPLSEPDREQLGLFDTIFFIYELALSDG
ncbi:MAG: hypothetical protein KKC68_04860 [Candidatus Thermoplasmatota archaeon]|nr:hypothetical protein [Candidatus Thermoplasmatota archaeon]